MQDLKDVIRKLKSARNKCVDTVDKSTLKEIDAAINQLESELKKGKQSRKINWLSLVIRVFALICVFLPTVNAEFCEA